MERPEPPDATLAERVRSAFARDPGLHELGIRVTVLSAQRRVTLAGVVATSARRQRAGEVARGVLPGFAVDNDLAVQHLAAPDPERLS